jgi:hypothetical protein
LCAPGDVDLEGGRGASAISTLRATMGCYRRCAGC